MGLTENIEGNNFYPKYIPEADWHCNYLWSTHRGCPLDCKYCSSKRLNVRFGGDPAVPRRLKVEWYPQANIKSEYAHPFKDRNLPTHGGIFVNPYCDMFALPTEDIKIILNHIHKELAYHKDITPIFQTKKPDEYFNHFDMFPTWGCWLGTTI